MNQSTDELAYLLIGCQFSQQFTYFHDGRDDEGNKIKRQSVGAEVTVRYLIWKSSWDQVEQQQITSELINDHARSTAIELSSPSVREHDGQPDVVMKEASCQ